MRPGGYAWAIALQIDAALEFIREVDEGKCLPEVSEAFKRLCFGQSREEVEEERSFHEWAVQWLSDMADKLRDIDEEAELQANARKNVLNVHEQIQRLKS